MQQTIEAVFKTSPLKPLERNLALIILNTVIFFSFRDLKYLECIEGATGSITLRADPTFTFTLMSEKS